MTDFHATVTWIWLSLLGRPNREIRHRLLDEFGSLAQLWTAACNQIKPSSLASYPRAVKHFLDPTLRTYADQIYGQTRQHQMHILTWDQADYPALLREIDSPPCVLYYYGQLPPAEMELISIVGARQCTTYGLNQAMRFAGQLAQSGVGIVSGMARGIDGAAHKGTLQVGGYTMAILACGIDYVYPPEHKTLYDRICQQGCVLSELPPGTPPKKQYFPARNRLIAGLSRGTLVVEARKSSGAMITVDRAIAFNREVYAIPGNLGVPTSEGCNDLIRQGAHCVLSPGQILEDIGCQSGTILRSPSGNLSADECQILRFLAKGAGCMDALMAALALAPGQINALLTQLEMKGFIEKNTAGFYVLKNFHFTDLP